MRADRVALHVNIDHVATLRQARGTPYPDPVDAAVLCERAGADGITVHLREDRRHIQDRDVEILRALLKTRLNLEMAATSEMIRIASRIKPDLVTLVPEKRSEQTTEGGLDVVGGEAEITRAVEELARAHVPVSLFIDPDERQVDASRRTGAAAIELHTGDYANAKGARIDEELERLVRAADHARTLTEDWHVAAGHGLTVRNVGDLVHRVRPVRELNIGHALVADAIFVGIEEAVRRFQNAIASARSEGAAP